MLTASVATVMQRSVEAVGDALPPGVLLIGGASRGRNSLGSQAPTYQFCNDRVVSDGIGVLMLSGPIVASVAVGAGLAAARPERDCDRSEHGPGSSRSTAAPRMTSSPPTSRAPVRPRSAIPSRSRSRAPRVVPSRHHRHRCGVRHCCDARADPEGSTVQLTTTTESLVAAVRRTAAVQRVRAGVPAGRPTRPP